MRAIGGKIKVRHTRSDPVSMIEEVESLNTHLNLPRLALAQTKVLEDTEVVADERWSMNIGKLIIAIIPLRRRLEAIRIVDLLRLQCRSRITDQKHVHGRIRSAGNIIGIQINIASRHARRHRKSTLELADAGELPAIENAIGDEVIAQIA